jgi:hypothetical protein
MNHKAMVEKVIAANSEHYKGFDSEYNEISNTVVSNKERLDRHGGSFYEGHSIEEKYQEKLVAILDSVGLSVKWYKPITTPIHGREWDFDIYSNSEKVGKGYIHDDCVCIGVFPECTDFWLLESRHDKVRSDLHAAFPAWGDDAIMVGVKYKNYFRT